MIKTVKKIKNQEDKVTCYKLIKQDDTIHFVPLNEKNTDYQAILNGRTKSKRNRHDKAFRE